MLQKRTDLSAHDDLDHDNYDEMVAACRAIMRDLDIQYAFGVDTSNPFMWRTTFLGLPTKIDDLVRVAESHGYDVIDGIFGLESEWDVEFVSIEARDPASTPRSTVSHPSVQTGECDDATRDDRRRREIAHHEAGHVLVALREPALPPLGWHVVAGPKGSLSDFNAYAVQHGECATPTAALRMTMAGPIAETTFRGGDVLGDLARRVRDVEDGDGSSDAGKVVCLVLALDGHVRSLAPGMFVVPKTFGDAPDIIADQILDGRLDTHIDIVLDVLNCAAWSHLADAIEGAFLKGVVLHHTEVSIDVEPNLWPGPDGWERAITAWKCPGGSQYLSIELAVELVPENRAFLDQRRAFVFHEAARALGIDQDGLFRLLGRRGRDRAILPSGHHVLLFDRDEVEAVRVGEVKA